MNHLKFTVCNLFPLNKTLIFMVVFNTCNKIKLMNNYFLVLFKYCHLYNMVNASFKDREGSKPSHLMFYKKNILCRI
jgi:hypothetical protein